MADAAVAAPTSDLASEGFETAIMGVRVKQIAARAAAAAGVNLAYLVGIEGRPLSIRALQSPLIKTAVAVTAADLTSDFLLENSMFGKAYGVLVPSAYWSEPILTGLYHYAYERFVRGNPGADFFTEFAIGSFACVVSDKVSRSIGTM